MLVIVAAGKSLCLVYCCITDALLYQYPRAHGRERVWKSQLHSSFGPRTNHDNKIAPASQQWKKYPELTQRGCATEQRSVSGLARRQGLACLSDIVHCRFLHSHTHPTPTTNRLPDVLDQMSHHALPLPRACDTSSLAAQGDLLRRGGFNSPLPLGPLVASLHICTWPCYCYHTAAEYNNKSK